MTDLLRTPPPIVRRPAAELSGRQRRHLRGLAHHLDPVVQVGKGGVTSEILGALDEALETHELIKVRVLEGAPLSRKEAAPLMAEPVGAHVVGETGRVVVLYRRHAEKPKVSLPPKG